MQITADQFSWNKTRKTASAFISDLQLPMDLQILEIFNPKTRQTAKFAFSFVSGDGEGDTQAWVFRGVSPQVIGWNLQVFNT
jgi:hypothetical protein